MRTLSLVLGLSLAGCGFSPTVGAVLCGAGGECPSGTQCCGEICRSECTPTPDAGTTDASADEGECVDTDGDGLCGAADNCPDVANPGQGDCDIDGEGDACDPVYESQCYTLRSTFSSGGGNAAGAGYRATGVTAEPAHSVSSAPGFRLRGGLLPRAPVAP